MISPYYENERVKLYCGDCLEVLPQLVGKYDLMLTDPPYSQIKGDNWDRIDHSNLLSLLDGVFAAAMPNMSQYAMIYVFCWPTFSLKLSSLVERYYRNPHEIIWMKQTEAGNKIGWIAKAKPKELNKIFPETERIIYASRIDDIQYATLCEQRRLEILTPLIEYFINIKAQSGIRLTEIQSRMKELTGKRYVFARHCFCYSQWEFPTLEQYSAASAFLPFDRSYEDLAAEYTELCREYVKVKNQYRYYKPQARNFSDLWRYRPVMPGSRGRLHSCQKPLDLIQDMIVTSCPPEGTVLDCFAGSGTTGEAAIHAGRRAILIEQDPINCAIIANRLNHVLPLLFEV